MNKQCKICYQEFHINTFRSNSNNCSKCNQARRARTYTTKTCVMCGETRALKLFTKSKKNPDGFTDYCKSHHSLDYKKYILVQDKKWQDKQIQALKNKQEKQERRTRHEERKKYLLETKLEREQIAKEKQKIYSRKYRSSVSPERKKVWIQNGQRKKVEARRPRKISRKLHSLLGKFNKHHAKKYASMFRELEKITKQFSNLLQDIEKNKARLEYSRQQYYKNKERCKTDHDFLLTRRANTNKWRKNNRDKVKKRRKEYLKENPLAKFKEDMRSFIRKSISRRGYKKGTKTEMILGIPFGDFKLYLEGKFLPGMNWENRKEWHIDHIVPLASAKNEDDIVKLNHYTNLQPLWAKDNLIKGAKYE